MPNIVGAASTMIQVILKFDQRVITNYIIPPHLILQPFVDNYVLSTSHGERIVLNSTWPASNETSLVFYMADQPFHYVNIKTPSPLRYDRGCIVGLQTGCNGTVNFNGVYHTFIIQFKANGFNKLFSLPASEFVNKLYYMDEVFGSGAKELNEKLRHAEEVLLMAQFADHFLLHFLTGQKKTAQLHDGITFVANELFTSSTLYSVEVYACKANMSVRNFGRRFIEQVGISPKFYCRLLRFNNAVNTKIKKPTSSWTSIAHECGYYDQMHMIRDFKQFAGLNPKKLFASAEELTHSSSAVNGSSGATFNEISTDSVNEEFVIVRRTDF
ncbi:AraC family transcriptional regulator [Flavitalea sp. BT771]|uniref:helix-turn-helix domain-containing protein n=1 Tax=Flavitalea sp. BT771 TaxID=3063329 RepID=UPI0026E18B05|nr:AraC family transcriptional regulator [Flavitalea sp. BT771]MDO6431666.1 AraC family transcriptional regulator [Flavitalea sp. BT771]MDV6220574.1 AraC family transcriptional regulator [Flavitalea sp. BT771]